MARPAEAFRLREGLDWYPAAATEVQTLRLRPESLAVSSPFQPQLRAAQQTQVHTLRWDALTPRVVSIAIGRMAVQARSFQFTPPPPALEPAQTAATPAGVTTAAAQAITRVKPPRDIIKLEDRLNYVLQPPLETILAERSLVFPFQPFPYQLEGVAFLYSRHAAVLADEMGLGKTMQAITTIRLLIRSGEAQRVLLVCPKPLVANWCRNLPPGRRSFRCW